MATVDAGGFSVNYDDIPKFIAALQDQQARLRTRLQSIRLKLATPPPANDDYSRMWANQAQPSVQTYEQWNRARQDDFQNMIDKLNTVMNNYKQAEQNNTIRP